MQAPEHTPPQHPHMSPPPYVHHFDSYSLVKQLQEGGYSQEQATTAMKAIRTLLAQNLDVAQKSLVSKSDVENVSVFNPESFAIPSLSPSLHHLAPGRMRKSRSLGAERKDWRSD